VSKKAKKKQAADRQKQQADAAAKRFPRGVAAGAQARSSANAAADLETATPTREALLTRHYLDVSAVRIQDWLGRTPNLRLRRGASILLSEATGKAAWCDRLPAGTDWNDEAGDLDGVVSLVAVAGFPDRESATCLAAAAREVVGAIRAQMPHCAVQAVAGSGVSYAHAYKEMEQARRDGDLLLDAPPAPAETVLAKACDMCRQAPVERRHIRIVDETKLQDLCAECCARVEAAGGTKGDREARMPRPERRMKEAVAAAGSRVVGFPDDFARMAAAGVGAGDDADTQLCLIYADGNRVGDFLAKAADEARRKGKPTKGEIVPALDGATLAALADAVLARFPQWRRPPVLAHVAGGDDLVVSVPAGDGWPFACALLAAFGARIAEATAGWPASVRAMTPCLSAGLVFHHRSHPFSDAVSLAKARLTASKRVTRGGAPSVAFLDLTGDGGQAPAGRTALPLDELRGDSSAQLSAVAAAPRSHRETLLALLRQADEGRPSRDRAHRRRESAAEALARRVVDMGHRPVWEAIAGHGATGDGVRARLEEDGAARAGLRQLLDLARWWPEDLGPRPEPAGDGRAREVVPA
jgi:hypothetical protein